MEEALLLTVGGSSHHALELRGRRRSTYKPLAESFNLRLTLFFRSQRRPPHRRNLHPLRWEVCIAVRPPPLGEDGPGARAGQIFLAPVFYRQ
jgi:hypothetical protein